MTPALLLTTFLFGALLAPFRDGCLALAFLVVTLFLALLEGRLALFLGMRHPAQDGLIYPSRSSPSLRVSGQAERPKEASEGARLPPSSHLELKE